MREACVALIAAIVLLEGDARSEAAPASPLAPLIAQTLVDPVPLVVGGVRLDRVPLRALYEPRGAAPLWVESADLEARIDALLATLRAADREGLDPAAYPVAEIERRRDAVDPLARAELDLLLSDTVMRYGTHVRAGARRPPTAVVGPLAGEPDPVQMALDVASAPDPAATLAALPPQTPEYQALRERLAAYREMAAAGGWPTLRDAPKLEPGAVGPAVRVLRKRLLATGELAADSAHDAAASVYDPELVAAVRLFQKRHGLAADGIVGRRTWAALNVTAEERVAQIVANLERLRWLPPHLGDRYVRINIPDYRLEVFEGGRATLEMPVIVGRSSWPTPTFSSEIENLVFNPPWYVPPRIAAEELVPRALADQSYFASQGIVALGGPRLAAAGSGVSDAGSLSGRRFRQAPGPKNPLGRIKFNMPNPYAVYLHDTPNKDKFRLGTRALSHGCVRVADARALAAELLRDMPEWDEGRRKSALSSWTTRTVRLRTPVPVHLTYATAWAMPDGSVAFREDIYGADRKLAREVSRPRSVRLTPPSPVLMASGAARAPQAAAAGP